MYGSGVAQPRWLNNRQAAVWRAYIHMNEHLYATLEDKISRDSGLSGADYKVLVPLSETAGGVLRARPRGAVQIE